MSGFFSLILANQTEKLVTAANLEKADGVPDEFKAHYIKYVLPEVKEFEAKRLEALESFRWSVFTCVLIAAIIIAAGYYFLTHFPAHYQYNGNEVQITVAGIFITLSAMCWWCCQPVGRYKSAVKARVFPNIFSFFGSDFKYSEASPLSVQQLKRSQLLPYYEVEASEDYVNGAYKGVGIELFETTLTKTVREGKTSRRVTVFHGLFIMLSMNKKFKGKTVVLRDEGMLGNWLNKSSVAGMARVALEDPVFESKFQVYGDDQVEARYLLTTSFMERLLNVAGVFGTSGIQCSFYDDRLLMMLPSSRNRFETSSIFEPATFTHDAQEILDEMRSIFKMIDILKLDERTGL